MCFIENALAELSSALPLWISKVSPPEGEAKPSQGRRESSLPVPTLSNIKNYQGEEPGGSHNGREYRC